jgi:hypothetical protein
LAHEFGHTVIDEQHRSLVFWEAAIFSRTRHPLSKEGQEIHRSLPPGNSSVSDSIAGRKHWGRSHVMVTFSGAEGMVFPFRLQTYFVLAKAAGDKVGTVDAELLGGCWFLK